MLSRHARGQVLPFWIFGSFAAFMLIGFLLSFCSLIYWQVRAQNAADAAAQAVLVPQEERWNAISLELYASAVEEYRIRRLIDGYVLDVNQAGGCAAAGTCASNYPLLQTALFRATQRYTNDVLTLQSLSASATFAKDQSDAKTVLTAIKQNCGQANGVDCNFTYSFLNTGPLSPSKDAHLHEVSLTSSGIKFQAMKNPPSQQAMYPATSTITACAWVPALFPSFFGISMPRRLVVAAASAASVPVTNEWISPGLLSTPGGGGLYQNAELYVPPSSANGIDWYNVIYGDRNWQAAEAMNSYTGIPQGNDFTAYLAWWSSMPIPPPSNATSSTACAQ